MNIRLALFFVIIFFSKCFASSCEYTEPSTKFIFGKTIDTIGDSHTWVEKGNSLRCLLRDKGLQYDFVGNHIDKFGFMHDGEGGDNTLAILNRLSSIPFANAYFVLAGTNDINTEPMITVRNLIWIAGALHKKNPWAPIYINTLLPATNNHNARIQEVNRILIGMRKNLCTRCIVIDAGSKFYAMPGWRQYMLDEVHLNQEGYEVFTSLIMESLKNPSY